MFPPSCGLSQVLTGQLECLPEGFLLVGDEFCALWSSVGIRWWAVDQVRRDASFSPV